MIDDEQLRIGRAVDRLLELAADDDALRAGMEALARSILRVIGAPANDVLVEPDGRTVARLDLVADEPAVSGEQREPKPEVPAADEVEVAEAESPAGEASEDVAPPNRRRPERDVVPMSRASFLALLDDATREVRAADQGTFAEVILGELDREVGGRTGTADEHAPIAGDLEPREYDAVLPGIATRARLRADVTRAVVEREGTGTAVDDALLHRARSEGCSLWMLDLHQPDETAATTFAECLDAVADTADFIVLLAKHDPTDRLRRTQAVRALAAVQSALRVATRVFRQTPDDDQAASFAWLKEASAAERIFVERHMRLEDPLDPSHLAEVMAPLQEEIDALTERATREASIKKRLHQVRYHAGRVVAGKGSSHDAEKIAEAVATLVGGGMPPSSLELRDLLLPIQDQLPDPDGHPAAYGRVIADLSLHRERLGHIPAVQPAPQKAVSEDVRRVAELLRGTEIVLVGGERRVEAERAVIDAFGLSGLAWFTLSDDPTLPELERAIAKPEVSAMFQLIRWSRHSFGDAAEIAAAHDKPFIRVPRGYNPTALAKAVLEQASDRLRDDLDARTRRRNGRE